LVEPFDASQYPMEPLYKQPCNLLLGVHLTAEPIDLDRAIPVAVP